MKHVSAAVVLFMLMLLPSRGDATPSASFVLDGYMVTNPVVTEVGASGYIQAMTFSFSTNTTGAWTITCRRPYLGPCYSLPTSGYQEIVITGVLVPMYDANNNRLVEYQLR